MTKRTRYFMAGAAATLVAGLGVGLVAYYGGFPAISASPTSGPAELSFVPPDASVVAYANVRDVMNSEFRQRIREAMRDDEVAQHEFQGKTGINIETDIDYVVTWLGRDGDKGTGLVMAKGRFNDEMLEAVAREHGGQVTDYRGKRLIVRADTDPNERHDGALAFLEKGLVAFGENTAVKRAIDVQASGQNISGNDEMMKLVGDIEAGSNAWAVGRLDALPRKARLPEQVTNQLSAVKWFAANGHVNGGISGTLRAEARDDQAAENLRDVVRGFLALAKLQASSDPRFAGLLNTLTLSGSGRTVALSFAIPAEILNLMVPKNPHGLAPDAPQPPLPPQLPAPPRQ
jgi:hypothetical protein